MKASDDLFNLIKKLSKAERTYFKKYSSFYTGNTRNNSIMLFDELNRISLDSDYDETALRAKFRGRNFLNQLSVSKNYLYGSILRSMVQYHTEKDIDSRLNRLIDSANILYMKGLFGQCIKITSRAKEISSRYGKYTQLLTIIHTERKALKAKTSLNEASKGLMRNYKEEELTLDKVKNISCYTKLFDEAVILATSRGPASKTHDFNAYSKFLNNPLLKNYRKAEYLESRIIFHQVNSFINRLGRNIKLAYRHGIKTIKLIETNENGKHLAPYLYVIALQNIIEPAAILKKESEVVAAFNKLDSELNDLLKYYPDKVKNFLTLRTLLSKINFNINRGNFAENDGLIKNALEIINCMESSYRDEKIVTYLTAAVNYFAEGKYSESLKYLNVILNSHEFPLRQDLQIKCRMFNLLLHFELGNYDYLENTIISVQRYISKVKGMYKPEKLLLALLGKMLKSSTNAELEFILRKTRDDVKRTYGRNNKSLVNIEAWIDGKLEELKSKNN